MNDVIHVQWHDGQQAVGQAHTLSYGMPETEHILCPVPGLSSPRLTMIVSINNVAGIWSPYHRRTELQGLTWHGRLSGSPYRPPALVALVDSSMTSRLCIAALPTTHEVSISWDLDQQGECYHIAIQWHEQSRPDEYSVLCCTAELQVEQVVDEVLTKAGVRGGTASNDAFYEPCFCTWYSFHADMDAERIENTCRLAKDMGFGSLILDDGWAYDLPQRVGAALGAWHRFQGDYGPSKTKFPDFARHIQTVQDMGLRYILWVSPFIIGTDSQAYTLLKPHLLDSWLDEGYLAADPRAKAVTEYLTDRMTSLVRTYNVDGFKVDYDYGLLGKDMRFHGVGQEYARLCRELVKGCHKIRGDFEYNLTCSMFSLTCADSFRCVDAPFDAATNLMFMANLKTFVGRAALQSDPALWSHREPVKMVHRHIVPTLFGVPSISTSLVDMPAPHQEALRGWLAFYRRYQHVMNTGAFNTRWENGACNAFTCTLDDNTIAATFSATPYTIDDDSGTLLINAGTADEVVVRSSSNRSAVIEHPQGHTADNSTRIAPGVQAIPCPVGSIVRLS